MNLPDSDDPLATLLRSEDPEIDLPLAALLVEADHASSSDVEGALESYHQFVLAAVCTISGEREPMNVVRALNDYFFVQHGMRGNTADFYDPRNCYLSQVLRRGLGTAATLAIPYIGALRESGYACRPVMLPGQLVLHIGADIFVDLFDGGRVFDAAEALRKARRATGGGVVTPHVPAPLTNKDLTLRILRTLKRAFRAAARITPLFRLSAYCRPPQEGSRRSEIAACCTMISATGGARSTICRAILLERPRHTTPTMCRARSRMLTIWRFG